MEAKEIEEIYLSTKEGRELHRIRQSFTFNLGILVMGLFKNPLKIVLFPYQIIKLWKNQKKSLNFNYEPISDYLVVGVDKTGEFYSTRAKELAERLQSNTDADVTLISNSQSGPKEKNQILWFRLPAARENNNSRKQWNITIERLLSTTISLSRPRKIIFFGEYLYRGIINSLEGLDETISQFWFYSDYPDASHLGNEKYDIIQKVCIPPNKRVLESANRLIERDSETDTIFVVDVQENNHFVLEILHGRPRTKILAIQRRERLPSIISSTINTSDVLSLPHTEGVFFIVDESSKVVPELASIEVPGILLCENRIISPVLAEMVADLELYGDLVLLRRLDADSIQHSVDYLVNRELNYNLNRERDDYVVKWLNSIHTN